MQLLALGSSLLIREMANEGQNKQEANLIFVSGGRPGFKVMGKQEDDGHFGDRKEAHLSSGGFRERTAESVIEFGHAVHPVYSRALDLRTGGRQSKTMALSGLVRSV